MSAVILVFVRTSRHEHILESVASVDGFLTVRADRDCRESDSRRYNSGHITIKEGVCGSTLN